MDLNKNNIKKILGIITFAILLFVGIQNINAIWRFLSSLIGLIFPFLLGGGIAFILNVPMRSIEKLLFSKSKAEKKSHIKLKRPLSLLLTVAIIVGIVLIGLIILNCRTMRLLVIDFQVPERIEVKYNELIIEYPAIVDYVSEIEIDWAKPREYD